VNGTADPAGPTVTLMTKQDMSRWVRSHADTPGIPWTVQAGPGGTLVITELAADRCTLAAQEAAS
jgi:hypothetical protein